MITKLKVTVEKEVNGQVANQVGTLYFDYQLGSSTSGQDIEIEAVLDTNNEPLVRPKQFPKF